jgi:signal transduction histidine kinase
MHLVLDFSSPPQPAGGPAAPAAAAALLACFQEALGHQLPNRLVAIQGLAQLLEADAGARLGEEDRENLGRLAALAQRTDRLVRGLADIGRLCREARSGDRVNPQEVARAAAAEVSLLYTGPAIGYDFPVALPAVPVSAASLRQVLFQLLRNAVHSGVPARPAQVRVGGRVVGEAGDGAVEVWVADDGRGLPDAPAERLFEPFGRTEPAAADEAPLGLGLFLVRVVVACWGGALVVDSQPGQGTRVAVRIPRR